MSAVLDRNRALALLSKLAEEWPKYREMGHSLSQRSRHDETYERELLVEPTIEPGDLLKRFSGVREISRIVDDEIEFTDLSGEKLFAKINVSKVPLKVVSMKIECPECFGEPQDPPCGICEGAGKV
ncbi:MAG TPA: hypothetical protein VKB34_11690 [Povalibacter sp.]|nr:hypothetical protein [Povalibacter sp.]